MQDGSRLAGSVRPGGRTSRTRAAVFDAAMAELAEKGFAGTGMEKIAARAGVATSTVYRRWGSLTGLLQDLVDEITLDVRLTDAGPLADDLAQIARVILILNRHPVHRPWMDAVVTAAVHDPAARQVLSRTIRRRIEGTAPVVARAAERGEIPADTDAEEVIRMLAAPFYYRMYISGEPITDDLPDRVAAAVVAAVQAGRLRRT
ncbi:TetR/AcrR family transcriptional regulator [Catellatospora sp. TT07R-123]|uniref:TetR/AcrR family transcriptional regulator n=1 Tax=Catellatospora sp. TT07R-123 TaxID=2733863 RepID=UPI001BB3516D|nr:TetR/AcrR family transcriptional regulator [Catellatospora sp. TT07R-123]